MIAESPKTPKTPITEDQFETFCMIMSESGESKRNICKSLGISPTSIDRYIKIIGQPAEIRYARAKVDQAEALFSAIPDKIEQCKIDLQNEQDPRKCNSIVQLCRLECEAVRWDLSKRDPKKYGDKIDVTTNGNDITREIVISPVTTKTIQDK